MIKRVFIKELLGFRKVELEFNRGLVVITGPSGAGKSVFMNSLLSNFGLANQEAKLCEVELEKPKNIESLEFDLEDTIVIKALKKDRVRYFVDGQNISKKALKELFGKYVSYISVRDKSGFSSEELIALLDSFTTAKNADFAEHFSKYQELFSRYKDLKAIYNKKLEDAKASNEKVEFLKYEIEKLQKLNIKVGEYEELLVVKKQLSKLDKISDLAQNIEPIFSYEDSVYELFNMLDRDSSYFSDAINQLRGDLDDISALSEELGEVDIEEVLNRLEEISAIVKRFGSEEEAIEYLKTKIEELDSFVTIEADVEQLDKEIAKTKAKLEKLASELSKQRKKSSSVIESELELYLKELKLPAVKFVFGKDSLYELGFDTTTIEMGTTKVESLSGGEFNRVRLALLTVGASGQSGGIIILDEIDANVSGDESIAIANMISKLSKSFQIFAISHQPHLSSKANEHILITKDSNASYIKRLDSQDRVKEIARIVGGESYTQEALDFAKNLFTKES
jgi:DNA repair protein RecN (Recombination protein N)